MNRRELFKRSLSVMAFAAVLKFVPKLPDMPAVEYIPPSGVTITEYWDKFTGVWRFTTKVRDEYGIRTYVNGVIV